MGVSNNFTIIARDVFGNEQVDETSLGTLGLVVNGSGASETEVNFAGNGTYTAEFWANTTGEHQVFVLIDGANVFGSPFDVIIAPGR